MSRRHTSTPRASSLRHALAVALGLALVVTALMPAFASAQNGRSDRLDQEWQLLTYRDDGRLEPVLAGVDARLILFAGQSVLGYAACSEFATNYDSPGGGSLFFEPPDPAFVDCDQASRDFDERFYQHLADTASYSLDGSILRLYDSVDLKTPLMVLTNAKIDDDPTVARWNVARIGGADGSVEPVIRGTQPWIEFLPGGSVVGSGACGSFLGEYSTRDGTMDVSDVRYRLRDCNEAALDQAQRTVETLAEVANFEVRPAGLVLQDANRTTRMALTPEIGIKGRDWTPTAIYDQNGGSKVPVGQLATSAVQFNGPSAEGSTICRPFIAESLRSGLALNVDARSIDFTGADGKVIKCPDFKNTSFDERAIDAAFIDALKATASHALRGSELELKDADGRTRVRLEPREEMVGPTWVVTAMGKKKLRKPLSTIPITVTFEEDTLLVSGDTGAGTANAANNEYSSYYELPTATRVKIDPIDPKADVFGRACYNGKKRKNTPACKQELQFLQLLSEVDTYVPKDGVLQLRKGLRTLIRLVPDYLYEGS